MKKEREGKCFSKHNKKWHIFDNDPFKEGEICRCKKSKIIKGVVTKIKLIESQFNER